MNETEIERVQDLSDDYRGTAILIKTPEPVTLTENNYSENTVTSQYWIVSSVTATINNPAFSLLNAMAGKGATQHVDETMVFPADETGEQTSSTDVIDVEPSDEDRAIEEFVKGADQ